MSLLVATRVSSASDPSIISVLHCSDLATIVSELPPDHPVGTKATVALVSFKRALHLDGPFLSTFIVDYLPGGSAVLHRSPTAGYVLVHVLSGEIERDLAKLLKSFDIYLAGPPPMVQACLAMLKRHEVAADRVHYDAY